MFKLLAALLLAKWCLPLIIVVCLLISVWALGRGHWRQQ